MRRIEYTPDFVNIYCDISIKWLQEIYFESIICMPNILFDKDKFKNYIIFETYISIDLQEWKNFLNDIVDSFRDGNNQRAIAINNVNYYLKSSEELTNKIYTNLYVSGIMPKFIELKRILEYFVILDSFAVFNMFIPHNYYNKIFNKLNISKYLANIDNVMVCSFTPHRLQLRERKLNLLKEYFVENDKQKFENIIKEYLLNYEVYSQFENTVFTNDFLKNPIYIMRELIKMSKELTINDIEYEIMTIKTKRKVQISKMNKFFCELDKKIDEYNVNNLEKLNKENIIEIFSFLIVIVSEEEKRHMIECKMFAILSEVFKFEKLDVARSNLKQILKTYEYLMEE